MNTNAAGSSISLGTCTKCGYPIQWSGTWVNGAGYHPLCCPVTITTDGERAAALAERLAIVAWLRNGARGATVDNIHVLADSIANGAHVAASATGAAG
jgi:hypothetical protein